MTTTTSLPPNGQAIGPGGASAGLPVQAALPPLNVSGLVVRKADLVAALRIYIPQLGDISALDDDRFLLTLAGTGPAEEAAR